MIDYAPLNCKDFLKINGYGLLIMPSDVWRWASVGSSFGYLEEHRLKIPIRPKIQGPMASPNAFIKTEGQLHREIQGMICFARRTADPGCWRWSLACGFSEYQGWRLAPHISIYFYLFGENKLLVVYIIFIYLSSLNQLHHWLFGFIYLNQLQVCKEMQHVNGICSVYLFSQEFQLLSISMKLWY